MHSLHLRLTLAASLVLTAFLGLAGYALDRAFRDSAETAVRERLQAHIYGLLAAADIDRQGTLNLPDSLPEERFQRPGSGLYAQVTGADGTVVWRSPSLLGQSLPEAPQLPPGTWTFTRVPDGHADGLFVLGFGSAWEVDERSLDFTFSVIEEPQAYAAQVAQFRRSLGTWFGALALGLLIAQGLVLRWGLNPLRRVERDLAAVEAGTHETLSGAYPRELRGLTDNLNALLKTERGRLARYRDALADLAHSLKTPLAVLRGARHADTGQDLEQLVREQTERMTQIVDYQLQRAATSGRTTLMTPVAIAPLLRRILDSLAKVYAERGLDLNLDADVALQFRADPADLMELCGNLLDNACKWARSTVTVNCSGGDGMLRLIIEDDGPGIDDKHHEEVMRRGHRLDEAQPGHGQGLGIVHDIAKLYGGSLKLDRSELGGLKVILTLPSA